MQEMALHNYLDAPAALPDRCLLQIHWYREPNFQAWLKDNRFRVLTIAQHPLDQLISALHFVGHEPQTARWLEGNAGLPAGLAGCSPCSQQFLEYATGFGAENFLAVSYQWWNDIDAIKLRYEDFVADPAGRFGGLVRDLDNADPASVLPWLERVSFKSMQALPNRHGWQATPGLWRRLIVSTDALSIRLRHRMVFRKLGYSVPCSLLSRRAALRNWQALA